MPTLLQQYEEGKLPPVTNLVCLAGERRRGKDFLTNGLVQKYGAERLSFSDEVRRLAQIIFPWFPAFDVADHEKDLVFVHPNNTENKTCRDIAITAGKARDVDGAYFVRKFVENQLPKVLACPTKLFVITDFRTPEEDAFLKSLKIPVIKILKDVDIEPHPFEEYIRQYHGQLATFHNSVDGTDAFVDWFYHFMAADMPDFYTQRYIK